MHRNYTPREPEVPSISFTFLARSAVCETMSMSYVSLVGFWWYRDCAGLSVVCFPPSVPLSPTAIPPQAAVAHTLPREDERDKNRSRDTLDRRREDGNERTGGSRGWLQGPPGFPQGGGQRGLAAPLASSPCPTGGEEIKGETRFRGHRRASSIRRGGKEGRSHGRGVCLALL